ncbi:MAG: T9SS type A sorting domain-containing protein [Bacteroidia bacterium]|nr:T9SS type A sorting domain-containing protein [Bacteroidia bacterium]
MELPQYIQDQINSFIAGNTGINPYDPDQIKIQVDFQHQLTGNVYTRYGFYYQDVSVSGTTWIINASTPHPFRVRFAPPLDGFWYAFIKLIVNNTPVGNPYAANFIVSPSAEKGHLQVGSRSQTLRYENGGSFYILGRNVAGASEEPWESCNTTPQRFNDQRFYIADLGNSGGNFIRIRMDASTNGIEWGMTSCGNYQNRQDHAFELDKTLTLCEEKNLFIMLCLQNDQELSTYFNWDGSDHQHCSSWGAVGQGSVPNTIALNPYYHLLGGPSINPSPDQFFTSVLAKSYFKKRIFYINARWGYSTSIGMWELINETDNLGDNGNGKLYTSSGFQDNFESWACEMSWYLKQFYPNHLVTNGYTQAGPGVNDDTFGCSNVDVMSVNSYSDDHGDNGENGTFNYNDRIKLPPGSVVNMDKLAYAKPFIIGEAGLMPFNGYPLCDQCTDKAFHNCVWSTAFSDHAGTALYWWDWEQINVRHNDNFTALSNFFNGVDFESNDFRHYHAKDYQSSKQVDFYYLLEENHDDKAMGWLHNHSVHYLSEGSSCISSCAPSSYTSSVQSIYDTPGNPKVDLNWFLIGKQYKIDFFDTYVDGHQIGWMTLSSTLAGHIKFRVALNASYNPSQLWWPDKAFKLYRINQTFKEGSGDSLFLPNDTLTASMIPLEFKGKIDENHEHYEKFWNFGNGIISNANYPSVVYDMPGIFNASLHYVDSGGKEHYIFQTFVVLDSSGTIPDSKREVISGHPPATDIQIIPNPAGDHIFLSFPTHQAGHDYSIRIYSVHGQLLKSLESSANDFTIDISFLVPGLYFLSADFRTTTYHHYFIKK